MELEVPNQITYSSTHAQLSLLGVDDSTDQLSTKGIATSVSTPAFISFSGFVSRPITISVTDPDGGTINYQPADAIVGDEASDVGYARVPDLGYFSSYSSIDSLATLASHEDLASLASAPAPAPAAITVIITPPMTGPTVDDDGLDVNVGPQQVQQAQHMQRFLQFQETQQARYAELFDDGVDNQDFDFFGYDANFHEYTEEGEDVERVMDVAATEADEWVDHQEPAHLPFLIPVINIPVVIDPSIHEPDAKEDILKHKDVGAGAEADKENHNPTEVANTVVEELEVVNEDPKDASLSTLLETSELVSALSTVQYPDLKYALDDEIDFGFDFGSVLDDIAACSLGLLSHSITGPTETTLVIEKVSEPTTATAATSTPALLATPNFAFTRSTTDPSPYSSPSVYSTESAPHSPYPFATPRPGQLSEALCAPTVDSPATSELVSVPAGAFDAYDLTCFDGLGFESMDLRLRADGSAQVVFDAGEDDETDTPDVGEGVEVQTNLEEHGEKEDTRNARDAGDDLFSHFEVEEREKNVENLDQLEVRIVRSVDRQEPVGILVDSSAVDKRTKMTAEDEAFEKWRQACFALAAFAHIPLKTAIPNNAQENNPADESEEQTKTDIFMVAVPEAIEVFVVTGSERTQTIDSFGPTNAATSFTTQPKIEPAVIPSALHEIGASAVAATLDAESGSEEATFEEDEAHAVCPPTDDIVSYIQSIPGPECMPSFATAITDHLSPAPAPIVTPASSFAIPVSSTLDDCALLSEPAPDTMPSSSSDSLHVATESHSSHMLAGEENSIGDVDNMPSLLAEASPFDACASSSIHSSSSFCSWMAMSDHVDGLAQPSEEASSEPLQIETPKINADIELPATDFLNPPLDTILELPEDDMDDECAELIKSLAELAPDIDDIESDSDSDFESGSIVFAPSPLLTVYEELAGGPQHLFNSLPRYARRSLDSLTMPWLASLSSLASLGGRSSVVSGQQEEGQAAHGTEVPLPDHSSISSGTAPAAVPEDDSWSLVASPHTASPLSAHTPLRPLPGPSSLADPPVQTPSVRKAHRSGFFMSRMTFCPSPSPTRLRASSAGSLTSPLSQPSPAPAPVAPQVRSGGRLRLMLRKLRTFSQAHLGVSLL